VVAFFVCSSVGLLGCNGAGKSPALDAAVVNTDSASHDSALAEAGSPDATAGDSLTQPIAAGNFTVHVPSEVGGKNGLVIRVIHPASDKARYAQGAPVVVDVPGGWDGAALGTKTESDRPQSYGYILVEFSLPGGGDTSSETQSGGEYDVRGPNCAKALRDVIRYASGELADAEGKTLSARLPFALTNEVGIFAGSNGGNLALVTLGSYGEALLKVKWFAAWESPLGDQFAAVELNQNEYYQPGPCTATTCPWPGLADALVWDPNLSTESMGGAAQQLSGGIKVVQSSANDLVFKSFPSGPTSDPKTTELYPSTELAAALREKSSVLWPGVGPPAWLIIDAQKNDAYWQERDGSRHIAQAQQKLPGLLVIHIQTAKDHVQTQPDYPHARAHVQGWLDASHAFVRLNPDAAYLAHVTGLAESNFPDNEKNTPVPWPAPQASVSPEKVGTVAIDPEIKTAAVLELADRVRANDTSANLAKTLY
jgi:hypothetical protein